MGKSTTTKSTSENKPPEWAKPLFEQSASEAQGLFNSGAGGNVFQGQTVAGLGQNTQSGIGNVMSGGADYGNLLAQAGQPSSARTNLSGMASGQNLMSNPFFNEALQGQLDSTAAQVQSQFSGSGRYGSGANTGALTNSLGNIRANALSNQYNQDVGNMLTANQMIDGSNAQSIASQLGVDQAQMGRAQNQIGAGQIQDQNEQAMLNADMARFYETDMKDWNRLGLLQKTAAGSAGNYGMSRQQETVPGNPFSTAGGIGSLLFKQ